MRHILATALTLLISTAGASAQAMYFNSATVRPETPVEQDDNDASLESHNRWLSNEKRLNSEILQAVADSTDTIQPCDSVWTPMDTVVSMKPLPQYFFMPAVYDHYQFPDTALMMTKDYSGNDYLRWIEDDLATERRIKALKHSLFFSSPQLVRYNIDLLPEAPKQYHAVVNPEDHTIVIHEVADVSNISTTLQTAEVKKRHWIRAFNASLQFSQAYVSPNWYQGGNNHLNMLANIFYNVKLNQEFHKNLLFEFTAQYKLGMNSTPDDDYHKYNISEDLFQLNTTFGLKAAKRWYYSLTAQFKTQMLNSYPTNSPDLKAAFMSPGELTAGIGMTYNYANAKKTFTFDASIAPVSYNLRVCTNSRIDPAAYDIKAGRKTTNKFGSSTELKLGWKISHNIVFNSRVFAFTDYNHAQIDWENTLAFEINRFLSTQIYVHARYDSSTPRLEDSDWHTLQLKEIFSIGFTYKFSSL